MFAVLFFENKNLLLTQLLRRVPVEGEELRIKGRKGRVTSIKDVDENKVHVQLYFEPAKKSKTAVGEQPKNKRR